MKEDRISGILRRVPKIKDFPKGPKQYALPERENDLRAFLGPKVRGERRWARGGELVWVKLDNPINLGGDAGTDATIQFWPGLIDEIHFRAKIVPQSDDVDTQPSTHDARSTFDDEPWDVIHTAVYKINLIVSTTTVLVGVEAIVPYQAHAPAGPLVKAVQTVLFNVDERGEEDNGVDEPKPHNNLKKRFEAFNPFSDKPFAGSTIQEMIWHNDTAAGSYALAIQTASRLTSFWTPTDSWDFKMELPNNASETFISEGLSQADQQNIARRLLGSYHAAEAGAVQRRFQGLWWGPERIWCGDLVRLKISRQQFVPGGNEAIKAVSAGGKSGRKAVEEGLMRHLSSVANDVSGAPNPRYSSHERGDVDMDDGDIPGAPTRSLFMLVDSLFVVSMPRDGTTEITNECRMSGMLYELADEDWAPDEDVQAGPSSHNTAPQSSSTLFAPNADLLLELPGVSGSGSAHDSPAPQNQPANVETTLPSVVKDALAAGSEQLVNFSKSDLAFPHSKIELPAKPVGPPLPLPSPPFQLKFRPILKEGHEVVFPLTQLAGRYYPSLLTSPLLRNRVREALEDFRAPEGNSLWALDGRVAGLHNAVDPERFLPRRSGMAREAERVAWGELVGYWKENWRRDEARKDAICID